MFSTFSTNAMPRIVIADDDQTFLRAMGRALSSLEAAITLVESGDRALAAVREGTVDVLLADVGMPGLSGDKLLQLVGEVSPSTVVVLMTGVASVPNAVEALRSGAFDYLEKPFPNEGVILRVMRRGLEYAVLKRRT